MSAALIPRNGARLRSVARLALRLDVRWRLFTRNHGESLATRRTTPGQRSIIARSAVSCH